MVVTAPKLIPFIRTVFYLVSFLYHDSNPQLPSIYLKETMIDPLDYKSQGKFFFRLSSKYFFYLKQQCKILSFFLIEINRVIPECGKWVISFRNESGSLTSTQNYTAVVAHLIKEISFELLFFKLNCPLTNNAWNYLL